MSSGGERLLVTGGAGFIGSHVVQQAIRRGWRVAVLDNLSTGSRSNIPDGVDFYEADLRDAQAVDWCLGDFRPNLVSHQAAQASVAVSMRQPAHDATANVVGTINLLESARRTGVEHVAYASTGGAIYGEVAEGAAPSDRAPSPISPYAASKLAAESYLKVYRAQYGIGYSVLRYANVYGPRQDPLGEAGVVAIFIERALRNESLTVNGMDGSGDRGCVRDYVFVSDVANVNLVALEQRLDGLTVNVATGRATTTLELAQMVIAKTDSRSELRFGDPRQGDVKRSVLAPSEVAGLPDGSTSLELGIAETIDWFRESRPEVERVRSTRPPATAASTSSASGSEA